MNNRIFTGNPEEFACLLVNLSENKMLKRPNATQSIWNIVKLQLGTNSSRVGFFSGAEVSL